MHGDNSVLGENAASPTKQNTSGVMKIASPFKRPATPESEHLISTPASSPMKHTIKTSSTPLKEVNAQLDITPPTSISGHLMPLENNIDQIEKDIDVVLPTPTEEQDHTVPPTPTESSVGEPVQDSSILSVDGGFGRNRHNLSKPPAVKNRIRCQCGAPNCRQWLF